MKKGIEHTFLGNNEIEEMMQMKDDKAKNKEFKINFIFDNNGESFEKMLERAFSNYCLSSESDK